MRWNFECQVCQKKKQLLYARRLRSKNHPQVGLLITHFNADKLAYFIAYCMWQRPKKQRLLLVEMDIYETQWGMG